MRTMSDLRDKIARALFDEQYAASEEFREGFWNKNIEAFRGQADAVLAVLADDLPEDVIERAARAVDPAAWDESQWQNGGREGVLPGGEGALAARQDSWDATLAVLRAAFGGEQA